MKWSPAIHVCLLCVLAFVTLAVHGVENPSRPEFTIKEELTGQEVPTYYHYQAFFTIAQSVLNDPNLDMRQHFFEEKLGLPRKPEIILAVRKAIEDGTAVLRDGKREERSIEVREDEVSTTTLHKGGSLHPDNFESDDAYRAEVRRRERERARALGRVLGELEATMEAAGVSLQTFHAHITGVIGASVTMASTDEVHADHHVWQVEHSFEAGRHAGYQSTTSGRGKK